MITCFFNLLDSLNNLRKRHVMVIEQCCMCTKSEESIDHLLLHCKVTRDLWESVFRLFEIEWVLLFWVAELLASWIGQFGNHCNLEAWRMAPYCVMWCILREHNSRNFKDCERMLVELKDILFKTLYGWMTSTNCARFSNLLEFLELCSSSP